MQEILVLPTLPVAWQQQSRFLARAPRAAVWAGLGDTRLSWGSTGRAGGSRNPALCSAEPGTALGFLEMRQMFCWVFLHTASQLLGTETEAHLSSTVHLYKIHGKNCHSQGHLHHSSYRLWDLQNDWGKTQNSTHLLSLMVTGVHSRKK